MIWVSQISVALNCYLKFLNKIGKNVNFQGLRSKFSFFLEEFYKCILWQAASNLVDLPHYSPKTVPPPTPPCLNFQQEIEDLEEVFRWKNQELLLLYAPYSP